MERRRTEGPGGGRRWILGDWGDIFVYKILATNVLFFGIARRLYYAQVRYPTCRSDSELSLFSAYQSLFSRILVLDSMPSVYSFSIHFAVN